MKYFLVKKSIYDALPPQDRKVINSVSTSLNESQFPLQELSGVEYYVIQCELVPALMTPLSLHNFFEKEDILKILESGAYTEEENLATRDELGREIITSSNLKSDEYHRVRHKGIISGTILSGESVNMDWKIDQLTYGGVDKPSAMMGVRYKVIGGNDGDTLDFYIVDVDNILGYGADVELDKFADNYFVFPNDSETIREHQANLITGLYVRAHYTNNGLSTAIFYCNILRYMDTR